MYGPNPINCREPNYEADYAREAQLAHERTRIEAHGVKGLKSTPWRKTFKNTDALNTWVEKNDAEVYATREVE